MGNNPRARRRILVVGILLVLVAILFLLLRRGGRGDLDDIDREGEGRERVSDSRDPDRPGRAREPKPLPSRREPPLVPIIDEIKVDKTEVCRGEEFLVSVVAHTPGHRQDEYLHYTVGYETGQDVPVVLWASDDERDKAPSRRPEVTVFGLGNVSVSAPIPHVRVKDCSAAYRLDVSARLLPNAPDEFQFWARILEHKILAAGQKEHLKERFVPARYIWMFGDGTQTETVDPVTTHSFDKRQQDTHYSQFLVSCTAVDARGEKIVGRRSLQLLNSAFEDFHFRGIVILMHRSTPRFPELGADGKVEQKVHVFHRHPGVVTLERISKRTVYGGGEPAKEESLSPSQLFPTSVLYPEGVTTTVQFDSRAQPEISMLQYEISGTTDDGYPASGRFSVMRPTDLPTKERHTPVSDPALTARIKRARELLGKEYVTDEDILTLERMGEFEDLPPRRPQFATPEGEVMIVPPSSPDQRAPSSPDQRAPSSPDQRAPATPDQREPVRSP